MKLIRGSKNQVLSAGTPLAVLIAFQRNNGLNIWIFIRKQREENSHSNRKRKKKESRVRSSTKLGSNSLFSYSFDNMLFKATRSNFFHRK